MPSTPASSSSDSGSTYLHIAESPWSKDGPLGSEGAWKFNPLLDLSGKHLASWAWTVAQAGIRDPFFWSAVRLRARSVVDDFGVDEVALLLGACLRSGLVDPYFLNALGRQLDKSLRWRRPPRKGARSLLVCLNGLLRLGLPRDSPMVNVILRTISMRFTTASSFEAALLATCLARLGRKDRVLLNHAEMALSTAEPRPTARQLSMFLTSSALLGRSRPSGIVGALTEIIRLDGQQGPVEGGRRTLLAVLRAECRWHPPTSGFIPELACVAAFRLRGMPGRVSLRPGDLRTLAEACRRWARIDPNVAALASRAIADLGEWCSGSLGRRWADPPSSSITVELMDGLFYFCGPGELETAEKLLDFIISKCDELSDENLAVAAEICAEVGVGAGNTEGLVEGDVPPHVQRAMALRSEVYSRAQEMPVKSFPRVLNALRNIVEEDEFKPVLRRAAIRVSSRMREVLLKPNRQLDRNLVCSGDTLGQIMFVFAACGYKDEEFLDAASAWIRPPGPDLLNKLSDLTVAYMLHSFAVLLTARGELLHLLVAAVEDRIASMPDEGVLIVLHAASLLQTQSDSGRDNDVGHTVGKPPPSGIGERALALVIDRLATDLHRFSEEDVSMAARLCTTMRIPGEASVAAGILKHVAAVPTASAPNA